MKKYLMKSLNVTTTGGDTKMYSVDKAVNKRTCNCCDRKIPAGTYHVVSYYAAGNRILRKNFCAACILRGVQSNAYDNKYINAMIKKAARESIKQGYCCEDKKYTDFCNNCPKSLDCFTTIKKEEDIITL